MLNKKNSILWYLGPHHLGHEEDVVQIGCVIAGGFVIVNSGHHPPVDRFVLRPIVADKTAFTK